jgi:hypothetical protein
LPDPVDRPLFVVGPAGLDLHLVQTARCQMPARPTTEVPAAPSDALAPRSSMSPLPSSVTMQASSRGRPPQVV